MSFHVLLLQPSQTATDVEDYQRMIEISDFGLMGKQKNPSGDLKFVSVYRLQGLAVIYSVLCMLVN
jgi:hypothetical protein